MFEDIREKVLSIVNNKTLNSEFVQYQHRGNCEHPCDDCIENDKKIFKNDNTKPPVGEENHPDCHCFYEEVETKPVGSISKMGDLAPDVYLKKYGRLPDYYITKQEAKEKYGWDPSKNTMAGKAPGKMIGGDEYNNDPIILPEKEGRIWYECDVDYESGRRNTKRLYYSNDGLMFYSDNHGQTFYYIK